jgi:hypothetical protein
MFGSVALFEADRVAQPGHRFLEIVSSTAREAISAASASAMTLSFFCAALPLRQIIIWVESATQRSRPRGGGHFVQVSPYRSAGDDRPVQNGHLRGTIRQRSMAQVHLGPPISRRFAPRTAPV